jgi:hypothetical protein
MKKVAYLPIYSTTGTLCTGTGNTYSILIFYLLVNTKVTHTSMLVC